MKKKGIFSQLFSIVTVVLVLSYIIVGTFLYGFLGDYLTKQRSEELAEDAKKLFNLTIELSKVKPDLSQTEYKSYIDFIASSTDTYVVIVNDNGDVVVSSGEDERKFNLKSNFVKEILDGKTVKSTGNLDGIFNTTMLTVGVPMEVNNEVFGGIIISVPMPEIDELRVQIIMRFGIIAAIVFVISILFTFFISRRIIKPLKELNNAAKSIAVGNYGKRVEIDSQNEVGELCDTFNDMAGAIERHEKARTSFLANVAHELRTPMTTITGFVEGVMDGTIPQEKHEQYLQIVLDESKRLSRLINDLMDMNKLEQGNMNLEMREFDVNEMIRLHIIKMEKRITEKNINLTVNFENENLRVVADKDSIQRVLINLVDNAIKFTQEGGFIDLRTGIANNKAFVAIQNSGQGVDAEDINHIFERFYKSDKSRSIDKTGMGLGLYIVKSIINAHREKIWAESMPGEFTRFNFTLPIASANKK